MLCITGQKTTHASQKQMFQKLAHAINTPLNGIIGCLELLNTFGDSFDSNDIKDLSSTSLGASKNLHRLLENLMLYEYTLNNQELATLALNKAYCTDSDEIIEAAKDKADELKRLQNIELQIEPISCIYIAKNHLKKIISELIDNACRFSINGSKISITGENKGSDYLITITDYGSGMSPEQIESIGPFNQFNHTENGVGLGLHISQTLTHLYGGLLQVKSKMCEGTKVMLSLPIK